MNYNAPGFDVNADPEGLVTDLGSLYDRLATLTDSRQARGKRYSLVTLLVFLVLAKLAGRDRLFGISEWVKERKEYLAEALHLKEIRAPHLCTYSRILGHIVQVEEFEQVVREFFAQSPQTGQSVVIALDGKTLRGTIRAGQTQGLHLLAAYPPAEGWVLMQVSVSGKENEVSAAPRLLKSLDLRGKIVIGDAMHTQRELSAQIVEAGGDYVWSVKDIQPELRQDIVTLFQPEATVKGFSRGTKDFGSKEKINKGHGRIERRKLTVSTELKGYLNWPGAEQVFKLERHVVRVADGHGTNPTVYGITSLRATEADPARRLQLVRSHWGIENGLHYTAPAVDAGAAEMKPSERIGAICGVGTVGG